MVPGLEPGSSRKQVLATRLARVKLLTRGQVRGSALPGPAAAARAGQCRRQTGPPAGPPWPGGPWGPPAEGEPSWLTGRASRPLGEDWWAPSRAAMPAARPATMVRAARGAPDGAGGAPGRATRPAWQAGPEGRRPRPGLAGPLAGPGGR
jgi:hypothetical protein